MDTADSTYTSLKAIAVVGSTVYVGGDFGGVRYLAKLDAAGALTQLARADKDVEALTVSGGTIYAAGQFTSIGLQHRGGLAAFDANGALTDWQPTAGSVNALAVFGTTIYIGGNFSG